MEGWGGETEDKDAEESGPVIDDFEWDTEKAASNRLKHGVTFEEATEAFGTPERWLEPVPVRGEVRQRLIGATRSGRSLFVIFTMRGRTARIIGARRHRP